MHDSGYATELAGPAPAEAGGEYMEIRFGSAVRYMRREDFVHFYELIQCLVANAKFADRVPGGARLVHFPFEQYRPGEETSKRQA